MLATLQRLGVVPSFSRPSVSDDNSYSESLFRTLNYCPILPGQTFREHRTSAQLGARIRAVGQRKASS